jgi:hypothetical protein
MENTQTSFASEVLTDKEILFNDFLQSNHPDLMEKALRAFRRYARRYDGGIYGYNYKGYSSLNRDIYVLARQFENDYADLMGVKSNY